MEVCGSAEGCSGDPPVVCGSVWGCAEVRAPYLCGRPPPGLAGGGGPVLEISCGETFLSPSGLPDLFGPSSHTLMTDRPGGLTLEREAKVGRLAAAVCSVAL